MIEQRIKQRALLHFSGTLSKSIRNCSLVYFVQRETLVSLVFFGSENFLMFFAILVSLIYCLLLMILLDHFFLEREREREKANTQLYIKAVEVT
jgi:hypothetical protein